MKNRKYKIFSTVIAAVVLLLSCKHGLTYPTQEMLQGEEPAATLTTPVQDQKTYLTINVTNSKPSARTIKAEDYESDNFYDFELKGVYAGETVSLLTATSLDDLNTKKIEIRSGAWELTLSAKYNEVLFSDTKTLTVKQSQENSVSFTLKAQEHFGGFAITFDVPLSPEGYPVDVAKAEVTLQKKATGETIWNKKSFDRYYEDLGKIIISCDITDTDERLESGLYTILCEFYGGENKSGYTLLNQFESYIAIADGLVSTAEFNLDFNALDTITYRDKDGVAIYSFEGNGVAPNNYSVRSSFDLPKAKRTGKIFMGWKLNDLTSSDYITKVDLGTSGNLNLIADFKDPVLYVSGVGDDPTGDGWTYDTAFESIDKACEKIIALGNSTLDWTIYICGDVTGPHSSNRKADERSYSSDYGITYISENLKAEYAKSILITGYQGLDANGLPQDMINRGLNKEDGLTGSSNDGGVLAINTEVPVTIKNLMLKNACNKNSNGSSLIYAKKGGGIYIGTNSTVTLSDGVLIKDNGAYNGSGVYNLGTLFINGSAVITANTSDDGGGIYNAGNLYLGYENESTKRTWTGSIDHNGSWRGAGIKNVDTGVLVMDSGTIDHNANANNSNTYGGGIYNMGSFTMTGGIIEYNECCHGGGVYNGYDNTTKYGTFSFSGGEIRNNYAFGSSGAAGDGGGVYTSGLMYIYEDAVIGDASKTEMASDSTKATISSTCSNLALGSGGGIYVGSQGKLYLGYSRYVDATDNTPASWNNGIFYNYAKNGGGGIAYASGAKAVVFNSGIIANNAAIQKGGAVYVGNDGFILDGSARIPAGKVTKSEETITITDVAEAAKQSIYICTNNYSLKINNLLNSIQNKEISLLPQDNSDSSNPIATSYNTYKPLIELTDAATAAGVTIDAIKDKFTVQSFTDPATGIVTKWTLNSEGKAVQNTESLTVSSTGPYTSLADAVAVMNDSTKDYIITLNGEITGPQVIEDPAGGKIAANSIKIVGSKSSNLSDTNGAQYGIPKDIINANLSENEMGSALTIKTTVPVTLRGIMIKGGHGTAIGSDNDAKIAGGGIFIGENATVSFENYATVSDNINYVNNAVSGAGAGVYISNGAKFMMNTKTKVQDNTGTFYGAGVYVADGGYLKMFKGSQCYIRNNSFDERFKQSGQSVSVKGGGVYLENDATFEMAGGYVENNTANTPGSVIGRGSGIFVSESANYRISGSATVTAPNDVYLKGNVKVQVLKEGLSLGFRARLTPASYTDSGDGICLVTKETGASATLSKCFEITPSTLTGGEKQYWSMDNDGKLIRQTGMGITVTLPSISESDIQVSVTDCDNEPIEGGTHFTGIYGTNEINFEVENDTDYNSFKWYVDGKLLDDEASWFKFDANTLGFDGSIPKGTYVVYLETTDSRGNYYSYTAQIKVSY